MSPMPMAVAAALKANPAVAWITYPGLPEHPDHALAQRLFPKGAGLDHRLRHQGRARGGPASSSRPCSLASHLANVGDAKTLVIHPASTTHSQMDAAALKAAGVGEDLVRLSVGLEAAGDIIDDLNQALRVSQKAS